MEGSAGYLTPAGASSISVLSGYSLNNSSSLRPPATARPSPASGSIDYSSSRLSTRLSHSTSALSTRSGGSLSDYSSYHSPSRASSCGYSSDEHDDSDDDADIPITGTKSWLGLKYSQQINISSRPNESSGWQGPRFDSSDDVISTPSWLMLRQRLQALRQDSSHIRPRPASTASANATWVSDSSLQSSSADDASMSRQECSSDGDNCGNRLFQLDRTSYFFSRRWSCSTAGRADHQDAVTEHAAPA